LIVAILGKISRVEKATKKIGSRETKK